MGAFYFYYDGSLTSGEGTSFASPAFTGALSTVEQDLVSKNVILVNSSGKYRLGRINDLIYAENNRPDVWYDILSGSNGVLPNGTVAEAGTGWDFVCGWGPADFYGWFKALAAGPPVVAAPNSISIFDSQGSTLLGTSGSVAKTDSVYLTENSVPNTAGAVAATTYTYTLSKPVAHVAELQYTLVSQAPLACTSYIYLLNPTTKAYDLISTTAMNGSSVKVVSVVPTKYINSSNVVTIVVRALYPARLGSTPFKEKVDQSTLTEQFD